MQQVIIEVDPHKLSATIEVVDDHERRLGEGRFTTDRAGYAAMRTYVKAWPHRTWAVEGANGTGRPLAQRLLESGEDVLDVPAKLAARVRLFDTGHNRKTDAHDAHSIAMVVDGGDSVAIGQAIFMKKGPGVTTLGGTIVTVNVDSPSEPATSGTTDAAVWMSSAPTRKRRMKSRSSRSPSSSPT